MVKLNFRLISLVLFTVITIDVISAQKIFMIGDSHVGSKIYPKKVEEVVKSKNPDAQLAYSYKNGLRFSTLESNPENLKAMVSFKPEILLVNLGTNEAFTNKFSPSRLKKGMESFYSVVKKKLPDVKVVFITPYTNKIKDNGSLKVNTSNRAAADVMLEFVEENPGTYVIDINEKIGNKFIDSPKLIRDNVHLTVDGYKMLGKEVGEGLLEIPGIGIE